MAKNNGCGCGRRNSNNSYGCLNSVGGRYRWDNYPYYGGPCPDVEGDYECDDERDNEREDRNGRNKRGRRRRRGRGGDFGIFSAMLPMAITANGVIPLVNTSCMCGPDDFSVNSGMITIEEEGAYLATYTVRVPTGATLDSTITLNVNDASQSTAIAEIGGEGPTAVTAQAIFDVCDRATVTLRSSEAINITAASTQPLVTLTLVKLEEE